MHPNEAERLLESLRDGRINATELKGEQFQAIIFYKLIERCGSSPEFEYELIDNYQGAVDFVVREKSHGVSPFHTENPMHVFECKYYRRTLELSTVAKLLVVGVRYQPTSLNIVSGTRLQPQVYDYAYRLFSGLGNNDPMFRRTFFRHYLASDLLAIKMDCEDIVDAVAAVESVGKSRTLDVSWEITEIRPFSEKLVAASYKGNNRLILDGRWIYRLKMSLFTTGHPERLQGWIEGLPEQVRQYSPKTEITVLDDGRSHVRFVQVIDPRTLEKSADGYLALHVTYATRSHHVFTIPVAATPHSIEGTSFPDLREDKADEFANLLQQRGAPRLLLLGGVAGVGKTHLCESISLRLRLTGEFDVNRFSANPDGETTLLHTMLVTLCTPAAVRSEGTSEWQELAMTLLNALSPVPESTGPQLASAQVEVLIPVLAELLVRSGPHLIVLRDAHLLTEAAVREFGALVERLDDLGWGDVYCIVEHRTTERENNPHWTNLENRLRARINGCLQWQLEPLTVTELNDFLDSTFIHITPELKNAVWDMCGGVPLYLFSFLELLNSEGAIRHGDGKRWMIQAPSAFLESTRTRRRADAVLEERLKAISWEGTTLPNEYRETPLVLVGLLVLAREPGRVEKLCHLIKVTPDEYLSIRRTLTRHNLLRPGGDEWTFDLQHELLRRAVLEITSDNDAAQRVVERVLGMLEDGQQTVSDLEFYADLALWIGLHEDAAKALNAVFERLRQSDNFTLIRRILSKLSESLKLLAYGSTKNYLAYLDCRSALAWATWNTGSLIEARAQYSHVAEDAISSTGTVLDAHIAEAYAADAQRRVLGIDLELSDIPRFIESAKRALDLNGHSIVFNSILNRLILYCAWFSHVDFGIELSHLLLQTFGDPEPESSGAVICSDIGALFRLAAPHSALELYRRGVQMATGRRQQLHNELDVLITETMLGIRQPLPEELAAWRQKLINNGLRSMLSRFDLFCASIALREGRMEQAQRLYQHVETSITVYRYEDQRLDLWNDRMIAALMTDDYQESHRLQARIVAKVSLLLEQRRRAFKVLQSLRLAIETQRKRFSPLAPLKLNIPSIRPAYSGIFVHILLNLESLARVQDGLKQSTLSKVIGLWPSDIDHAAALDAFLNQPESSIVEFRGARLVLRAQ